MRAYIDVGFASTQTNGDQGIGTHANRGFIQWAGFTFGEATSFFDFYSIGALSYLPSYPASSTAGTGWMVAGYTAQFGNGFSGTIAVEQPRTDQIIQQGATTGAVTVGNFAGGMLSNTGYGGFSAPDIVGNLRVDQAWGSAQVMAAAHRVNGQYYASSGGGRRVRDRSSRRQVGLGSRWRS